MQKIPFEILVTTVAVENELPVIALSWLIVDGVLSLMVADASGPCCEHLLTAVTVKLFNSCNGKGEFIISPKGYSRFGLVTLSTSPSSRSNDSTCIL